MFASYSAGSIAQRKLTSDDVEAVCAIYPPDRDAACDVEPRGGFSASCGGEEKSGLCTVASVGLGDASGTSGRGGPGTASFAVLGLGVLAAARLSRRTTMLRRRS
jgi:hypothetical protein